MNRPARRRAQPLRPATEELEGRRLLSAPGQAGPVLLAALSGYLRSVAFAPTDAPWAAGGVLTYSFAPDGTDVGGVTSSLDRAMAARGLATADWEAQFDRAAATWEAATGVRFVRVPDDGEPIGSPGVAGGGHNFGDIRIAGIAQGGQWLAGTFMPPPDNLGTVAGDIVLNTDKPWAIDADGLDEMVNGAPTDPAALDLLTVALHEFGHDLGVGELADPDAVGYGTYDGIKRALAPADLANVAVSAGVTLSQAVTAISAGDPRWSEFTLRGGGDSYTADLVVDTAGFFQVFPWATGGPVRVTMTGAVGAVTLDPGGATLAYLAAGLYQVRVEDAGPGPVTGLLAVRAPDYEADALLANGVGEAPAASFRMLTTGVTAPGPSATVTQPAAPMVIALPGPAAGLPSFAAGLPFILGGTPVGRPTAEADHVAAVGPGAVALAYNGSGLPGGIPSGTAGRRESTDRGLAPAASGPADLPPIDGAIAEGTRESVDTADGGVLAEVRRLERGLSGFSAWFTAPLSGDPSLALAAPEPPDADRAEVAGAVLPQVAAVFVPALVLRYRRSLAAWLGRWRSRSDTLSASGSSFPPAKSPRRKKPSRVRRGQPAAGSPQAARDRPWSA